MIIQAHPRSFRTVRNCCMLRIAACWETDIFRTLVHFNPKTAWGGQIYPLPLPPPYGFSKSVSSKESVKPSFFVALNIIIRHIFSENFIEIPQVVQKLWRISVYVSYFHRFSSIFRHFLVTKKLMTSTYNSFISNWPPHPPRKNYLQKA